MSRPKAATDAPVVLRSFQPNAGTEAWYRQTLQALVRAMFESMLTHVRAAYRAHDPSIGFASDADPVVSLRRRMERWSREWANKLNAASDDIAQRFARRAARDTDASMMRTLARAGFTVRFKPTTGMKSAYRAVSAEQVNLIRRIPAQFLTDVQSSVWQSVMRGGDLGALTDQITQKYGISWRHAAFIARDQSAKAKAVMEEQRRSELGITEAIWQHSSAGKVPRPTHVAMNGKRYDISKGMWDSAIQKFVWPGTEPNCRCTSRAIVPGVTDE